MFKSPAKRELHPNARALVVRKATNTDSNAAERAVLRWPTGRMDNERGQQKTRDELHGTSGGKCHKTRAELKTTRQVNLNQLLMGCRYLKDYLGGQPLPTRRPGVLETL